MILKTWGGLLCILFFVAAGVVQAQEAPGKMSADELLDYTLNDLQTRIQNTRIENQKQEAHNDALRKRILFLREETRGLDDNKLSIMKESLDMAEQIKIDDKHIRILKDNVHGLDERSRQLKTQQALAEDRNTEEQRQYEYAGGTIEELQRDVAKLQKVWDENKPAIKKEQNNEDRDKYRAMISEILERGQEHRRNLVQLKHQVALLEVSHREALDEQNRIKEKLAGLQQVVTDEHGLEDKLSEENRQSEAQKREVASGANKYNESLSQYLNDVTAATTKLKELNDKIASQFSEDQKQSQEFVSWFKQEKVWLQEKIRSLQETVKNFQDYVAMLRHRNELKTKLDEWGTKNVASDGEKQRQVKALNEKQTALTGLKERYQTDQKQMEEFKKQLVEVKRSPRSRPVNPQVAEINSAISQQIRRNRDLRQEIASAQHGGSQKSGDQEISQNKTVKDQLAVLTSQMEEINQKAVALKKEQQALSLDEGQARQATIAEIEALKLRNQILASSLNAVNGRTKDLETGDSQTEQRQLIEYLDLLKLENAALQDKVTAYITMRDSLKNSKH